jgi:hypothetical protein
MVLNKEMLLTIPLNSALQYIIRKIQESKEGLEMNEKHQLLVYVDSVSILRDNMNTIKENKHFVLELVEMLVYS